MNNISCFLYKCVVKVLIVFLVLFIHTPIFAQNKGASQTVYHLQKQEEALSTKAYYQYKLSLIKKSEKSALNTYLSENSNPFNDLLEEIYKSDLAKIYDFSVPYNKNIFKKYPVSFDNDGKTIYFSLELKSLATNRASFCILSAKLTSNKWKNITILSFSSIKYSCKHPFMDSDNENIYFASNKKDGFGGYDIYYATKTGSNKWSEPVNMGSVINTTTDEMYPFFSNKNTFYFSSDKAGGFGSLDIYKSIKSCGKWETPINMLKPINSQLDDIGILVSENQDLVYNIITKGNIYRFFAFENIEPAVDEEDVVLIPNAEYCANVNARDLIDLSNKNIDFEWTFDDGTTLKGVEVDKCFQTLGKHTATLNVINKSTKTVRKNVRVIPLMLKNEDDIPVYISGSFNKDSCIVFDASGLLVPQSKKETYKWDFDDLDKSNFTIPSPSKSEYYWDFGDGQGFEQGVIVHHTYTQKGIYNVSLIIWGDPLPDAEPEKNLYFKKQVVIH